jgi:hypothetical protein
VGTTPLRPDQEPTDILADRGFADMQHPRELGLYPTPQAHLPQASGNDLAA